LDFVYSNPDQLWDWRAISWHTSEHYRDSRYESRFD
jgi:hypothetical protein